MARARDLQPFLLRSRRDGDRPRRNRMLLLITWCLVVIYRGFYNTKKWPASHSSFIRLLLVSQRAWLWSQWTICLLHSRGADSRMPRYCTNEHVAGQVMLMVRVNWRDHAHSARLSLWLWSVVVKTKNNNKLLNAVFASPCKVISFRAFQSVDLECLPGGYGWWLCVLVNRHRTATQFVNARIKYEFEMG